MQLLAQKNRRPIRGNAAFPPARFQKNPKRKMFTKTALSIFVLFAFSGAPFLTELHAETMVKTQGKQTVEVDWLEGDMLKGNLSPAEQEEALKRIKKHPYWKMLPPDVQRAVEKNRDRYNHGKYLKHYIDSRKVGIFIDASSKYDGIVAVPTMWQHIDIINAPVQTPPVNPKTGRPYVAVADSVLAGLSDADRSYVEKLAFRLNENIHYLGNSPLPRIDLGRLKRGEYVLSAVLPLTMNDSGYITTNHFMKNNQTTRQEQIEAFNLNDPVAFDLGYRLLLPLRDPRVVYPRGYAGASLECSHAPRGRGEGGMVANPIFLGWSYYLDKPEAVSLIYKMYLEESHKTVQFFMKKLREEKERITDAGARGTAEKSLIEQTEKIGHQLENVLEKELKTYKKTYKKPPRTLLDPAGKAYDAYIRRHAKMN